MSHIEKGPKAALELSLAGHLWQAEHVTKNIMPRLRFLLRSLKLKHLSSCFTLWHVFKQITNICRPILRRYPWRPSWNAIPATHKVSGQSPISIAPHYSYIFDSWQLHLTLRALASSSYVGMPNITSKALYDTRSVKYGHTVRKKTKGHFTDYNWSNAMRLN